MNFRGRQGSLLALLACALAVGCSSPPKQPNNLCAIFGEKASWHRASVRAAERWGVPEWVQLAIIYRESSFRADARPARARILKIIPGRRPSSAYGYGQVLDTTWRRYIESSGRYGAQRDDFGDVTDFIGWYAHDAHKRAGVSKTDAYTLYLAYHEGSRGFQRGSHRSKPRLLRAAREVSARAKRYRAQYARCRNRLGRRWWWPF